MKIYEVFEEPSGFSQSFYYKKSLGVFSSKESAEKAIEKELDKYTGSAPVYRIDEKELT